MNLPPRFISTITNIFGEVGEYRIANLLTLVGEASAHATLSAWWGTEDHTGWDYAMQGAELFAGLK